MELTEYWKIFRTHWLAMLAIILAGTLIGFGWALVQPRVYISNASGIVSTGVSSELGTALAGDSFAKSRVKSYLDVAKSRTVAERAAEDLGFTGDPDSLVDRVSVENPVDTATLKVSARASTAEEARDLAEAWVKAVGAQVAEIENANALEEEGVTSIITFTSLDSAQLPSSPSSPNTQMNIALGFLLGVLMAVGYAMLRNIFDRRIQSITQVERETGLPVIGTLPFHGAFTNENRLLTSTGGNDQSSKSRDEYVIAEAVRELRTNLLFMNVDKPPRVMVVTSALPGEGKTTVTANLAQAIAASGQRVVLIDGDLRRPMVTKIFGLLPGIGLTDLLIGRADLADVLQPWGSTGRLDVLGAGKIPPNPSELLGSDALQKILEELSNDAVVLIDAPPLLPVTDAAILAARTDGALVVSYARRTTVDALQESLGNIERVKGTALGVILNGVPQKGAGAAGYGYRDRSYSYYGAVTETEKLSGKPRRGKKGRPSEAATTPVGEREPVAAAQGESESSAPRPATRGLE